MPNIIFKGITRANDSIFDEVNERPKNAKILNIPENNMLVSLIFAIPLMIFCFCLIFVKKNMMNDFPMIRHYIPIGIVLGFLCCLIHELLHAIPQPKGAKVYIGFIPSKFIFYMKCKEPLLKGKFILMSLLPILLGIVPLIIFMISNNQILNSIMWAMAMIGLVSPSPDYLNVYCVLKQVPKKHIFKMIKKDYAGLRNKEKVLEVLRMSKYDPLWKYLKENKKENYKLSYEEIKEILGFEIDHSFLTYKKESKEFGYEVGKISMKEKTVIFSKI